MQSNLTLAAPTAAGPASPLSLERLLGGRSRERRAVRLGSIEGRSRPAASDEFARLLGSAEARRSRASGTRSPGANSPNTSPTGAPIVLAREAKPSWTQARERSAIERLGELCVRDQRRSLDPVWSEVVSFVVMVSMIAAALLL